MTYVMDLHAAHKERLSRMGTIERQPRRRAPRVSRPKVEPPAVVVPQEVVPDEILIVPPNWRVIVKEVCAKHGVSLAEIIGNRRAISLVVARHEAFYRLSTETMMSLPQIGYRMGGKDHTTVLHGIRRHKKRAGLI